MQRYSTPIYRVLLKQFLFVKTLQIVCQAHPREPGHELGVASGWTWRLPQGVAMLIRNKTYISLLFAGSNWAGIILRPVGGDPRVMLVMSCKKKLGSSATDFNVALQRMQKKVQPQELYVRTAWTTMENHKKFVHCPLSPSFFFSRLQCTGAGEPSIACIGMPTSSSAKKCGRPAPRPDGGQRKQQRYRMVHK